MVYVKPKREDSRLLRAKTQEYVPHVFFVGRKQQRTRTQRLLLFAVSFVLFLGREKGFWKDAQALRTGNKVVKENENENENNNMAILISSLSRSQALAS